jgi:hypothetical protein
MTENTVTYAEHQMLMLDFQAADRERRSLARKVIALERDQAVTEDSPEAKEVRALLDLWWEKVMGSNKQVAHGLDSSRAKTVRAALRRRRKIAAADKLENPKEVAFDICRRAVLGVVYDDWAMGRIKKSGGKSFNCIAEYILNTDGDIEKYAKMYDQHREKPVELDEHRVVKAVENGMRAAAVRQVDYARGREAAREHRLSFGDGLCPWDRMLEALQTVGSRVEFYPGKPDSFKAQCPAHDDRHPSLGVKRAVDGRLLLFCWAGCETADILAALGLAFTDLFEGGDLDRGSAGYTSGPARPVVPLHLRQAMRSILGQEEKRAA